VQDGDRIAAQPVSEAVAAASVPAAASADNRTAYPLEVGDGIAFDRLGREIVHALGCKLDATNTFVLAVGENGQWCFSDLSNLTKGRYILAVHYAEEKAGGVVAPRFCGCSRPERAHVHETAVFSLREKDRTCPCGESACPGDGCDHCLSDACKGDIRGPHARLSRWISDRKMSGNDSHLHCWGKYEIALHEWVDLACLTAEPPKEHCLPIGIVVDDGSGPRRLVKNNDLLFDLVRGCDLTHIREISWEAWHRRGRKNPVLWSEFQSMFCFDREVRRGDERTGFFTGYKTKFIVTFSGQVKRESIRTDAVVIRVITSEGGTGWGRTRTIPVVHLDSTPSRGDPDGPLTDQFVVEVRRRWVNDEIKEDGESELRENDFVVEFEVRGDLLEDCEGLTVDANPRGLAAAPTGNGTPGGTFISRFAVKRMPRDRSDTD
jgi:hypothetical protein